MEVAYKEIPVQNKHYAFKSSPQFVISKYTTVCLLCNFYLRCNSRKSEHIVAMYPIRFYST